MDDEGFGEAVLNHHDMHGRRSGDQASMNEMWSETSRPVKVALLVLGLIAIASLVMVSYNISGRGSTHIASGTGIDVVKYDKEHYVINAVSVSRTATFGFNNFSAVNSGDIVTILDSKAKDTHLYDVAALQNTIVPFASGDVSYVLVGTSINVSSIYRYEHSIHWHAVVSMGIPLERVCGYVGLDSLPNATNVEFDGIHALQCADADADGFALFGGSTTVSLEGDHTVQLRLASNQDLQKRGFAPAELVHAQVTITVV